MERDDRKFIQPSSSAQDSGNDIRKRVQEARQFSEDRYHQRFNMQTADMGTSFNIPQEVSKPEFYFDSIHDNTEVKQRRYRIPKEEVILDTFEVIDYPEVHENQFPRKPISITEETYKKDKSTFEGFVHPTMNEQREIFKPRPIPVSATSLENSQILDWPNEYLENLNRYTNSAENTAHAQRKMPTNSVHRRTVDVQLRNRVTASESAPMKKSSQGISELKSKLQHSGHKQKLEANKFTSGARPRSYAGPETLKEYARVEKVLKEHGMEWLLPEIKIDKKLQQLTEVPEYQDHLEKQAPTTRTDSHLRQNSHKTEPTEEKVRNSSGDSKSISEYELSPKSTNIISESTYIGSDRSSSDTENIACVKNDHDDGQLISEASVIHKILPCFGIDDIQAYLEKHKDKKERVKIVTEKFQQLSIPQSSENGDNEPPYDKNVASLIGIFPDADLKYLKELSAKSHSLDKAIEVLLETPDYPRRTNSATQLTQDKISGGYRKEQDGRPPLKVLFSLFPQADPEFLVENWSRIGHDQNAYQNFITEQLQHDETKDQFNKLTAIFPDADPQFLRKACVRIGNDENEMDIFIQQQKKYNEKESRYKALTAIYPQVDPQILREACNIHDNDEDVSEFIYDKLQRNKIEDQYTTLVAMFPDSDRSFLREYCNRIGGDENAMKRFITEQNEKIRNESQFKKLKSLFPEEDPEFLRKTCDRIGDDESAIKLCITEHIRRNKRETQFRELKTLFPEANSQFLRETCDKIGDDKNAMTIFINEQIEKVRVEAQCKTLITMFPQIDAELLRSKNVAVGADEEAMRAFVTEELRKITIEEKYKELLVLLPCVDHELLRQAVEIIGDDDNALKEFVKDQQEEMATVNFDTLLAMFPDADPDYLVENYNRMDGNKNAIKSFVVEAMERGDYPTMEDFLRRRETDALKRKYKEEFDIEDFIDNIPDPFEHFNDERDESKNERGKRFCMAYLEERYKTIPMEDITTIFERNRFVLTATRRELENWEGTLQPERESFAHAVPEEENISVPFLQEVAFLEHECEIREFLLASTERKRIAFEEAKDNGTLFECPLCNEKCLMIEDTGTSTGGHIFCKICIRRGTDVAMGNGFTKIMCFDDCGAEFSIKVLQSALRQDTLVRLLRRKQMEEVEAAGIEGLESCPFCNFASIPPEGDKTFRCLNPDCMRESCRLCHKRNHLPLKCKDLESNEQVKMRLYIEEKMTEALVRLCWKCGKKFIKEEGCNSVTCPCGARMCYLCKQPIDSLAHFRGDCQQYSTIKEVHDEVVKNVGMAAKTKVLEENPDLTLLHDPTRDFEATEEPRQEENNASKENS